MSDLQDAMMNPQLGFYASTWRADKTYPDLYPSDDDRNLAYGYAPSYDNYAPVVTYAGPTYLNDTNVNVSSIYGTVFWYTFFRTIFPSINQAEFLNDLSTGTPGGYYTNLYSIALKDFYDSFFEGRDDAAAGGDDGAASLALYETYFSTPSPGTPSPMTPGDIVTYWTQHLTYNQQSLIIEKYLLSRGAYPEQTYFDHDGNLVDRRFQSTMFINNLNLRSMNVFFYVANLMVLIMEELQSNTISASQYATRLAQVQQSLSMQMTNPLYNYKTMSSADDYVTQNINQNHGQQLENMRQLRDLVQKQTDQASSFLETSQQAVEDASNKAMKFLKQGSSTSNQFFRAF